MKADSYVQNFHGQLSRFSFSDGTRLGSGAYATVEKVKFKDKE